MGLLATQTTSGSNFDLEPISEQLHRAVCYGVIDLGTHTNPTFNKEQRKVRLMFELPDETGMFTVWDDEGNPTEEKQERRRVISKEYTLSLDDRANLYKDLVSWRGKKFSADELAGFELENLVGATCQLQVVHNQSKADPNKVYANINSILPKIKSDKGKVDDMENGPKFFSFDDYEPEEGEKPFDGVPGWIVEKIKESHEWQMIHVVDDQVADEAAYVGDEADDNVPF